MAQGLSSPQCAKPIKVVWTQLIKLVILQVKIKLSSLLNDYITAIQPSGKGQARLSSLQARLSSLQTMSRQGYPAFRQGYPAFKRCPWQGYPAFNFLQRLSSLFSHLSAPHWITLFVKLPSGLAPYRALYPGSICTHWPAKAWLSSHLLYKSCYALVQGLPWSNFASWAARSKALKCLGPRQAQQVLSKQPATP